MSRIRFRQMAEAPRDGTPLLLKLKDAKDENIFHYAVAAWGQGGWAIGAAYPIIGIADQAFTPATWTTIHVMEPSIKGWSFIEEED